MLGWGGLGGDVCQARCRIQGQAGCDDRAVLGGLLGAVVQLCLELGAVGLTSPPRLHSEGLCDRGPTYSCLFFPCLTALTLKIILTLLG